MSIVINFLSSIKCSNGGFHWVEIGIFRENFRVRTVRCPAKRKTSMTGTTVGAPEVKPRITAAMTLTPAAGADNDPRCFQKRSLFTARTDIRSAFQAPASGRMIETRSGVLLKTETNCAVKRCDCSGASHPYGHAMHSRGAALRRITSRIAPRLPGTFADQRTAHH